MPTITSDIMLPEAVDSIKVNVMAIVRGRVDGSEVELFL